MRKLLLSTVASATLFATASMAANVATDGTGDFLIAPAYYANNGFDTKLKIVNTNTTNSVILRGVVREHEASQEIDFIITLSPSDVWEGTISTNAAGAIILQSTDDSNYKDGLKDGVDMAALNTAAGKTARTFDRGYVEFFPVAQYNEGSDAIVAKSVLWDRFDALIAGDTTGALEVDDNSVAGFVTLNNPGLTAAMTLPMLAIEAADNAVDTNVGPNQDTNIANILEDSAGVYTLLTKNAVTALYENSGANNSLYFTFWGDETGQATAGCAQKRTYLSLKRDMSEAREVIVAPTPTSPIVSPTPVDTPVVVTPNSILCEQNDVSMTEILGTGNTYAAGMVQLSNIVNVHAGQTKVAGALASSIVTQMSATQIGSGWSYSWNYIPFK
jgi:hypothetical protein